jgi:hypothetical protein
MAKNPIKHVSHKIASDNEKGARRAVLEDLFYDFHSSRRQVYKINFVRGLFFGLGSVLGGTVLIALLVWVLSFFVQLPGIGNSVKQVEQTIQRK